MSFELVEILRKAGHPRLLVVGDLVLDRYTWADAERISQEAPVMLLREDHREVRLGGAANVANMLRGLDACVTMAGLVGGDDDGKQLRELLATAGVDTDLVMVDPGRPTTVKHRLIGLAQHRHPHQVLRIDRESREAMPEQLQARMLEAITARLGDVAAVLVSDYAKGVCTPPLVAAVIAAGREAGIPVIVDPASNGDCAAYAGATAITPNRLETARAICDGSGGGGGGDETGIDSIDEGLAAAERLREQLDLQVVFVTLDSDGIALAVAGESACHVPTRRREVYDITGAGDMVLATIGLAAAEGATPIEMARLANTAGGLEVEQIGVVTVSRAEMIADLLGGRRSAGDKIRERDDLATVIAAHREAGQRIVLTNGCFDLLHAGHVACLEQAAAEGDCLVVAVNSDLSVRGLDKPPGRPIVPEDQRAALLAALQVVDYVTIFEELTPLAVIEALKPDVLVKGGTYTAEEIVGWELVESYGGRVKPLGLVPGLSTSELIARILASQPPSDEQTPPASGAAWRRAG